MMLRRARAVIAVLIVLGMFGACATVTSAPAGGAWFEQFVAKSWVTALQASTAYPSGIAFVDGVVVIVGRDRRVVYSAHEHDRSFGRPVESPDGTHVAFVKTHDESGQGRAAVYVINLAHGGVRPAGGPSSGSPTSRGRTTTAHSPFTRWAHDRTGSSASTSPPARSPISSTGDPEPLEVGSRGRSSRIRPGHLTTGGLSTRTTVTRHQTILGLGTEPTWSPDGRWIAVKLAREYLAGGGKINQGEYILIAAEAPHGRTLLFENPRPFWESLLIQSYYTIGFDGPALWSPDGRFVIVWRFGRGEGTGHPFAHEIATRKTEKLPDGYWVRTLGGRS